MSVDLDLLAAAAHAATPGPWHLWLQGKGGGAAPEALGREVPDDWGLWREAGSIVHEDEYEVVSSGPAAFTVEDCEFIAACDPQTVLALIAVVRAAVALQESEDCVGVHERAGCRWCGLADALMAMWHGANA